MAAAQAKMPKELLGAGGNMIRAAVTLSCSLGRFASCFLNSGSLWVLFGFISLLAVTGCARCVRPDA